MFELFPFVVLHTFFKFCTFSSRTLPLFEFHTFNSSFVPLLFTRVSYILFEFHPFHSNCILFRMSFFVYGFRIFYLGLVFLRVLYLFSSFVPYKNIQQLNTLSQTRRECLKFTAEKMCSMDVRYNFAKFHFRSLFSNAKS